MCFNNENWSLNPLFYNIHSTLDNVKVCFIDISNVVQVDRFISWNNGNYSLCQVLTLMLMVVVLTLDSSVRASYGGVIRNSANFYLSGF